jgi:hypothetical protein
MLHGIVLVAGGETVGNVGRELPPLLVIGGTLVVGAAVSGLIPRLPISYESNGIPDRALPFDEVVDV